MVPRWGDCGDGLSEVWMPKGYGGRLRPKIRQKTPYRKEEVLTIEGISVRWRSKSMEAILMLPTRVIARPLHARKNDPRSLLRKTAQ